ncbi:glycosyltransferase family 2 protein [Hyphomicrobium sp.]|uniref:glycosyltransferase family 2 protein n=1 Tax=Hyphomicrobium sp. TaxID=82 RepID=UPI0025C1E927|nr:glycosyltransferase family 2 protein [Hyphomicrobium sp.]
MTNSATRTVSVIIGTRDRPALLREALQSIRALEGPDLTFEILIGDNGSTPETAAVAAEFGASHWKTDKNGCAAARNLAMRHVTGEFVAFLDDDDLWLPEHIRPHIAFLDAHPDYEAAFGQIVSTDTERRAVGEPWPSSLPSDGDVFHMMLRGYFPQVGGSVFRGNSISKYGLMDETLIGDSDWDWQLRIARNGRVGFIPTPCVLFRQRPPGTFDRLQLLRQKYTKRIFRRHVLLPRTPPFHRLGIRGAYRAHAAAVWQYFDYFCTNAVQRSKAGDYESARYAVMGAFRTLPHVALSRFIRSSDLRDAALTSLLGSRASAAEKNNS